MSLSTTKQRKPTAQETHDAIARLHEWFQNNKTIYAITRKPSAGQSGLAKLSFVYFTAPALNDPPHYTYDRHPTHSIAQALKERTHVYMGHDVINVTGYGFCKAEHIINERLSYVLYKKPNQFIVRSL